MKIKQLLDINKENEKTALLKRNIRNSFVGQDDAVNAVLELLERIHSGLVPIGRPIGSALFLGPTGTGKTMLVETLANALFGDERAYVHVDCGEYQHSHEIAKLVGSPPGYLGHRETPPYLTESTIMKYKSNNYPIGIVLFDEIEKASDALWHLLLGVLDKARLQLGDNSNTDFSKVLVLMTSNAGSQELYNLVNGGIGFPTIDTDKIDNKRMSHVSIEAAKKKFTPEFINRIDKIVAFNSLTEEQNKEIVTLEIRRLQKQLFYVPKKINLHVTNTVKDAILKEGYDPKYNGRSIRRTIEKNIQFPISKIMSSDQLTETLSEILVDYNDGKYEFYKVNIKDE